jgi:hypothetical protein
VILDRPHVSDVQKARRAAAIAGPWRGDGPAVERHAKRNQLGAHGVFSGEALHELRRDRHTPSAANGDSGRKRIDERATHSVLDVFQSDELTARWMKQHRPPATPSGERGRRAAPPEKSMDQVEWRDRMFFVHRRDESTRRTARCANIVNASAKEIPLIGLGLLSRGEDVNLVATCESFDEPKKCRDDAIGPASIDPTGNHHRDLHAAVAIAGVTVHISGACHS